MPYETQQNVSDTQRGQRIASGPANEPIGTLLAEMPKVEASIQEGSPVPGMTATAESSLQSLYDFDREIEGRRESPVAAQAAEMYGPEYMSSPAIYEGSASRTMADQAGSVSDLWDTITKFKSLEGQTLNNAMNLIMKLVTDKTDRERAEEERVEGKRRWEAEFGLKKKTAGLTPGAQTTQRLDAMQRDVDRKTTFTELLSRYGNDIEEWRIREAYNAGPMAKEWGAAKETSAEIARGTVGLPKLRVGEAKNIALATDVFWTTEDAISAFDPTFTGPLDVLLGAGRKAIGRGKPGEVEFKQRITAVRTTINNLIAGAALTEFEEKQIRGLTPKITDSDQVVQEKMNGLKDWARRRIDSTMAAGGHDITADEYLQQVRRSGQEGVEKTIRVIEIKSGKSGTIPEGEFDPEKYRRE